MRLTSKRPGRGRPKLSSPATPPASPSSVGARVQALPDMDRILALARLAEGQKESGDFSPADLEATYTALALPAPARPSDALRRLQRAQFAVPVAHGRWRLTPVGRERCATVISELEVAALHAESVSASGAFLGQAQSTTLPALLAPPTLLLGLRAFLVAHPFERNVFAMTRFPGAGNDAENDPVRQALDAAREACRLHGLEMHLASDRAIHDDLWTNVAAHMWASRYGIAFFESRTDRGINYNMTIEVGGMLMTGRRCALLKDRTIDRMPTDLVGHIYKSVDFDEPAGVGDAIHAWLRADLSLGSCAACMH